MAPVALLSLIFGRIPYLSEVVGSPTTFLRSHKHLSILQCLYLLIFSFGVVHLACSLLHGSMMVYTNFTKHTFHGGNCFVSKMLFISVQCCRQLPISRATRQQPTTRETYAPEVCFQSVLQQNSQLLRRSFPWLVVNSFFECLVGLCVCV